MSRKALESAVEIKRHKADNLEKKLWRVMRSIEALNPASCTKNVLQELVAATEEFGLILQELDNLREQDKYGVFGSQATLTAENSILKNANDLILKIKDAKISDKSPETSSVLSRHSHRSKLSRTSTSSSVARLRDAAEAAAAKEQAEHEDLIAEKENEMKQREAEEEERRQQARAQHEKDIAIMSANKRVAIAKRS